MRIACQYQADHFCGGDACTNGSEKETKSRLFQMSGSKESKLPDYKKPAVFTSYDNQGKPKHEYESWWQPETKTSRTLRECSADQIPIVIERYWFEGSLEAFLAL